MIDLDAMDADPWQTWPVNKQDLRGLVDEIKRLRAALEKIAQHDLQAIAMDALRPGERVRAALPKGENDV
tara:strand:+ start:163 stop:372 length:210 start_codon:yes stop_codon:yes gene_type:complete